MKKIYYIKGNILNGNLVIQNLLNLGGINYYNYKGNNNLFYYYIGKNNFIKILNVSGYLADILEKYGIELKIDILKNALRYEFKY